MTFGTPLYFGFWISCLQIVRSLRADLLSLFIIIQSGSWLSLVFPSGWLFVHAAVQCISTDVQTTSVLILVLSLKLQLPLITSWCVAFLFMFFSALQTSTLTSLFPERQASFVRLIPVWVFSRYSNCSTKLWLQHWNKNVDLVGQQQP